MEQVSMVFKGCADSSELDEPMGCQTNVTIICFLSVAPLYDHATESLSNSLNIALRTVMCSDWFKNK
jgi:hypothetical protein